MTKEELIRDEDYSEKDAEIMLLKNKLDKANERIEELEQENQQLKEKYLNAVADYETTKSENQQLKEHIEVLRNKFDKYKRTISPKKLLEEHDLYKSVLDEIREYINNHIMLIYTKNAPREMVGMKELLQILDKVKE